MRFFAVLLSIGAAAGVAQLAFPSPRPLEPYAGCYTDIEGFVLAIGADLRAYRKATSRPDLPMYREMSDAAYAMHRKAIVPRGDGWVFQPGGYAYYPDFAFAGWDGKTAAPESAIVKDIAWDVSHFMRWSLWLKNFEQAEISPQRIKYYRDLRRGLANQMVNSVLIPPSHAFRTYRLNNYMDGRNGYFRWDKTSGSGVAPYEMTGSFILGWWTFLDDKRVNSAYRQVSSAFPLSESEQNTFFVKPTPKYNSLTKHFTRLAILTPGAKVDAEDLRIWENFEAPYLTQPLWVGQNIQPAYHDLMVPMHVAFENNLPSWQKAFAAQFSMFLSAKFKFPPSLDELHYLHFAARFMALAARSGKAELIPAQLPAKVESRLLQLWNGAENSVSLTGWGEPEFKSFNKYLGWKLQQQCPRSTVKPK